MNVWKDLDIFCRNHQLDWKKPHTQQLHTISSKLKLSRDQEADLVKRSSITSDCPYCGCKRHLRLWQKKWHCFYCGHDESYEGDDLEIGPNLARELQREQQAANIVRGLQLWEETIPINNTLGMRYLHRRGLEPPPNADAVMRWHPNCPFGPQQTASCIISLFRDALTDKPTGIHRTAIYSEVGRSQKKAMGQIAGSAIKLWPLGDSQSLAVGEGIESVLAAVKLGIAPAPAWAVTVADNLKKLPVIPAVRKLTILADNDEDKKKAGELAARALRRKWITANREVVLRMPTEAGTDFNDILRRRP
jgi:hypothetical protein